MGQSSGVGECSNVGECSRVGECSDVGVNGGGGASGTGGGRSLIFSGDYEERNYSVTCQQVTLFSNKYLFKTRISKNLCSNCLPKIPRPLPISFRSFLSKYYIVSF